MASASTNLFNCHITENNTTQIQKTSTTQNPKPHPDWYSPETGIYHSKHTPVELPSDPFLDVVSFLFSHKHHGVSALIDPSSGSSVSYPELYPLVESMASGLHIMGVSPGDVVLILLPNSIYYPIVFLGVLYLGAIVTTMNPLSKVLEIKKQIDDCNVCLAFTSPEKVQKLQALGIPAIAVPEDVNLDSKQTAFSAFFELISGSFGLAPRPVIKQQDTAAIMYSSGTTGMSKGVVLTHGNFIAMLELFVRFEASQYEYSSVDNVFLAVLPMFHIYGLSLFVLGLLSLGSSIVVMRKFDMNEAMNVIDRYNVTHFPVVPPMLSALTRKAKDVVRSSCKSLKQVSCGAAPLTSKVIEDFIQTLPDVDLIQGYGMTESTAVGTRGFNTENIQNYSSVGLLAPNMQAKVVDWSTGSFLPPGSGGELWLRGPAIMKGYLNNAEATMSTVDTDGWLHTGDIVCFDQEGYIHIFDRLKEIIKYKGFQIAPADLEAVLISHPEILDVAVTGTVDGEYGEIPVAFVVRKHGSRLSSAGVMDYVSEQVAPYKKVRKVVFTNSIPKSAAGKILRRELRILLTSKL
ncbi:4-coumarate--CoA ligase-like 6 [Juglans microcarpa x Juglans regia]|uniref:4-coumarate--CoA ligase-like 6 n=1 Tax=Juglans microcarpa x Juglans regia TaxID=2249226 RepID=UPI001B7EC3D7|nr:4-coumarate--CoA ligase-like 6 [Juglans microcarpa x Juglans regia]XP_040987008.1 4-coumarate--CoA ligase-like 6 [Juglans microcarpa x Juglans regia]XP_040987009.1 4-coumarate--CoA ligase-like 6 [Juglans microcarpa x Juglans regia]